MCLHPFCFKCIKTWCKSKPSCPLCNCQINTIIHNVKSDANYLEYIVPPPDDPMDFGDEDVIDLVNLDDTGTEAPSQAASILRALTRTLSLLSAFQQDANEGNSGVNERIESLNMSRFSDVVVVNDLADADNIFNRPSDWRHANAEGMPVGPWRMTTSRAAPSNSHAESNNRASRSNLTSEVVLNTSTGDARSSPYTLRGRNVSRSGDNRSNRVQGRNRSNRLIIVNSDEENTNGNTRYPSRNTRECSLEQFLRRVGSERAITPSDILNSDDEESNNGSANHNGITAHRGSRRAISNHQPRTRISSEFSSVTPPNLSLLDISTGAQRKKTSRRTKRSSGEPSRVSREADDDTRDQPSTSGRTNANSRPRRKIASSLKYCDDDSDEEEILSSSTTRRKKLPIRHTQPLSASRRAEGDMRDQASTSGRTNLNSRHRRNTSPSVQYFDSDSEEENKSTSTTRRKKLPVLHAFRESEEDILHSPTVSRNAKYGRGVHRSQKCIGSEGIPVTSRKIRRREKKSRLQNDFNDSDEDKPLSSRINSRKYRNESSRSANNIETLNVDEQSSRVDRRREQKDHPSRVKRSSHRDNNSGNPSTQNSSHREHTYARSAGRYQPSIPGTSSERRKSSKILCINSSSESEDSNIRLQQNKSKRMMKTPSKATLKNVSTKNSHRTDGRRSLVIESDDDNDTNISKIVRIKRNAIQYSSDENNRKHDGKVKKQKKSLVKHGNSSRDSLATTKMSKTEHLTRVSIVLCMHLNHICDIIIILFN